ncbi:selenide, water dikinase SelD [Sediminispirochaeta bajacaliforniensis]|uniref:selenide, water dikinase SelD n=1 Tax=Sediminispirochaeta bajacaliforniensis TaxID=148 RepID=UPI00037D20DF|nr:selenide, water dikinase SelD [Sediminispirochaeta bajacaliforniensis]
MKDEAIKLTGFTRFSGCGAKLGPGLLDKALCGLSQAENPAVLSDFSAAEDAGVYKIDEHMALVQTVDFFPPIVDDPFTFGRIAAANALSDVFAMGGTPLTALTILCYPKDKIPLEHLRSMMEGGISALSEASCSLVGGHSVDDPELKLGFSITGRVDPQKVWRNNTLRKGDALIFSKALGTGLINTALRAELASEEAIEAASRQMATLNLSAMEILKTADLSACTDVTGFGLLGHAAEMVSGSAWGFTIKSGSLKLLPDVMEYASMGLVPEGTYRNKEFRLPFIANAETIDPVLLDLLFDPQTSGGLLAAVSPRDAERCVEAMNEKGLSAALIGSVEGPSEKITIA